MRINASDLRGEDFKYERSREALEGLLPWFGNDLEFIENEDVEAMLVRHIIQAVQLGEDHFNKPFGGWHPDSNEFGMTTLRPHHVDHPTASNNRWLWTCGSSTSVHWANDDSFVDNFTLADTELIMIYGYFNLEAVPNTIELDFQPGDRKFPIINIQSMRAKDRPYIILPEPIIVGPNSSLTINASVISLSLAEEAGLLGYLFAPNAVLITK